MSKAVPRRHWRTYGSDPLPTGAAALNERLSAFPSWFLRVACERCGQERLFNEAHAAAQRQMLIRDILERMRHDGCGGKAGKAELVTGIEAATSRPVRRIVLREGRAAPEAGNAIEARSAGRRAPGSENLLG
jgi:hypothetical protein